MMKITTIVMSLLLSFQAPQSTVTVHINDSDAIDFARTIAHDEGYDVANTSLYSFDLLHSDNGKPFLAGYTSIAFDINGNHRNLFVISNSTGQVLDYNTCEIFDYPDLKPFQERIMALTKTKEKTPRELASNAGCSSPKVLTKPLPISK